MSEAHHDARRGRAARYEKVLEPRALESMRRSFNLMNRGMVPLWRLGLARVMNAWPTGSGRLLVIEHVGRVSGKPYRTPVDYAVVGDDLYVLAAFGANTHWYRNLLAAPETAVWLPDGRWLARAEDASADPDRIAVVRQVLLSSGLVAPLLGLHPRQMSDAAIDEATSMYRVLRLRPIRREDSPDGPGSLAWLWFAAALALLLLTGIAVVRRTPAVIR